MPTTRAGGAEAVAVEDEFLDAGLALAFDRLEGRLGSDPLPLRPADPRHGQGRRGQVDDRGLALVVDTRQFDGDRSVDQVVEAGREAAAFLVAELQLDHALARNRLVLVDRLGDLKLHRYVIDPGLALQPRRLRVDVERAGEFGDLAPE